MAKLIVKRLSKLPIGTHIEITYSKEDDILVTQTGIVTDNDFQESLELTDFSGKEAVLDYEYVRLYQPLKTLTDILKELPVEAKIRFSYGDESNKEPDTTGTVIDNDNEEGIEIRTSSGKELGLDYTMIRSLLLLSGGDNSNRKNKDDDLKQKEEEDRKRREEEERQRKEEEDRKRKEDEERRKKDFLHTQFPEDLLNLNDKALTDQFNEIPYGDRKKLNNYFESFKYGIKVNDRTKMASAALQCKQTIFREYDNNYDWSREAVLFCGYLLRRTSLNDPEVFLLQECFLEASCAAFHSETYNLAGAYAVLSLLEEQHDHVKDLLIILASSAVRTDDISGISFLRSRMHENDNTIFTPLIEDVFAAKGMNISAQLDIDAALVTLETLYAKKDMAEELRHWFKDEPKEVQGAPESHAPKAVQPSYTYGSIAHLNWMDKTGRIDGDDGISYSFRYGDITDEKLAGQIRAYMRGDMDGNYHGVRFTVERNEARNIQANAELVERARAIAANTGLDGRFFLAYELCKRALETSDTRRALGDLFKHTLALHKLNPETSPIRETLALYEKHITQFPSNAFALLDVAVCYGYTKQHSRMMDHLEKALAFPDLTAKQAINILNNYMRMAKDYYDICGNKTLLSNALDRANKLKADYAHQIKTDPSAKKNYANFIVPYRITIECSLNMLAEAETDFTTLSPKHANRDELAELLEETRQRLKPAEEPETSNPSEDIAEESPVEETIFDAPDEIYDNDAENVMDAEAPVSDDDFEEEIIPYSDPNGWKALHLTKKDVVDYALNITGPDRVPYILAYLRAAAALNSQIQPVYHAVALAVNDPMAAPDYSITALVNALAGNDSAYPELNDCCMGAAYLRASFLSGRGYDYSAQALRDSISITRRIPALHDAYDTLEQFRMEVGYSIDIYADYRNQGVKKLTEDQNAVVRRAEDLYTKFVLNHAREDVKFARLLETKNILFHKDGYLATMLRHVISRDHTALESQKDHFAATFMSSADQFSPKHISSAAVDQLIAEGWDAAGKNMMVKKATATLQGNRRNNLRSNVSDVLTTICQWYALSEQSAGLTWRTDEGVEAYQRLRPQLMEQLHVISDNCASEADTVSNPQLATGLFLLAETARELSARLDGSWEFEQEKYLYTPFLRDNQILLNDDFMPDLSSTFCALPDFNILARIRRHVEGEKYSLQEQTDRIFGTDKTCNNYGTANRILEYQSAIGLAEVASIPENADQYISQTELQVDLRYRSFLETYALAVNYGQIIKTDAFCYTLEETVRYWYSVCKETKNYGFFTSILHQAENQIHESAQEYEVQLDEQLDALIASNQQYFDLHPDYAEAIRIQITNQNFTVAEDWMARIRIGDFSLEVQQPEALDYMEQFLKGYATAYAKVANAKHSLQSLLGRREVRNKDTKRGQQLIDNWLNNGNPSNCLKIEQLLNLLGWQNIQVRQYQFAPEPRSEIYEIRKAVRSSGLVMPLHPIAAFGSHLENTPMYVACLYGIYDCDRLYTKMRALDAVSGSKVILLDYALGQADRRALAKKLKMRESSLRNVNIVIDRVLIKHLSDNYNEGLISRMLMSATMPFTYCQPYVVESIHTMPPEIFIGRKDELLKIEQSDGVNLIYGGRQLGKSALFKKALADLDGHQNQRAVLIDINKLDCASTARKVSSKLIDMGITPDAEVTDDWDTLCRNIERRLRSTEEPISYFLLMLDEADTFISDCAGYGYRPLVALKDVQQSLPGRFKYVLAGLHNVVKFNRQVALGNNSVIPHIPSLKVTPFRTPEAQELLTMPLSYLGFSLPSKVTVSQILATCNYFPGLIQLYAKKLIESIRGSDYAGYDAKRTPPYVVSDEHLRRVIADKEFVAEIHNKFEATLTLDEDQGSCYFPLTLLIGWMYNVAPSKSGYTAKDILAHARDLSVYPLADLDAAKIDALLQELQDLNILRSVSNNSYLLASKNFRDLLGSDEEIFEKLTEMGGAAV